MEHDVCADDALGEGMRTVEVAGHQVLLVRHNGVCHAIGAVCPHAGGPLGEGVLRDGVVICPWHKAAFRVATGQCVEPPAVDDVARFAVRVTYGRIRVTIEDEPDRVDPAPETAGRDTRTMAILGAGAVGAVAAQTLREAGFSGRVVMVSREDALPYDRTVLSKYTLSGKKGGEKTPLQDATFYDRHRIERRTAEITALDPARRTVSFADGSSLAYDSALLATGGAPRTLHVVGGDLPGVRVLRSMDDAAAIVADAARARHVVVVGAGYIGLEAAGSLRERGLAVTLVAPGREPLEDKLGPEVGAVLRRVHERQGVVFRLGDEVAAVEGEGRAERVRLKSGDVLPADLVVVGLGVVPATALLHGTALREDKGIDVDARLRVADGLYAGGDIAAFPLLGDGDHVRVEHWRVAEQHGRVAALNMLGQNVSYTAAPYFWTIHYKQRLDYVGHAETWDEVVVDGDLEKPEFLAFYVKDGRVLAVAGWKRDRQTASAIELLSGRADLTVDALRAALA